MLNSYITNLFGEQMKILYDPETDAGGIGQKSLQISEKTPSSGKTKFLENGVKAQILKV